MTSVRVRQDGDGTFALPLRRGRMVRQILLACGVLSPLLYGATDVLGGLRQPGYSFTSQAVSELMAVGSASETLVDPLFLLSGVLGLAFAIGVYREAVGNRALRLAAIFLIGYTLLGFTGPTLFEMQPRGTGSLTTDTPHIVVTGALVLLTLLAIGFAAFALGTRFRVYSFATLLTLVIFGTLAGSYAPRLAAGEPTPGFGIIERIDIYASMLWMAVLAIALLRHPVARRAGRTTAAARIDGWVAPGFEAVRAAFERNFAERGEIGAAVAAYWRGEKVVDLWGGRRMPDGDAPWDEDTMVPVMSTTKGLAAMTIALANSRGWVDYDAPIARYWPEFAQNGKAAITVRQLLDHEAGLVLLDEELTVEKLHDFDEVARILARQRPAWTPGTRYGYHAMSIGLYAQELIRRVDPWHRTLGRFFHEEIARPLELEFHIGLPRDIPDERIARLKLLSRARALAALRSTPPTLITKILSPRSLARKSLLLGNLDMNDRRNLEIELAAGSGVGTARAIARAYSAFANGGTELGLAAETFAQLTAPPAPRIRKDEVLGIPAYYSLGYLRPGPELLFGSTPRAFGTPGAGGSFGFADPEVQLGYAYVMNRMDFHLINDPREKALRDEVYRAIERLSRPVRATEDGVAPREITATSPA